MTDRTNTAAVAPRRAPEMYVRAEVATYPVTSLAAFRLGLVELDPWLEAGRPTFRLWRACEDDVAQHATGLSIDRMVAARDLAWFRGAERGTAQQVPMAAYLRGMAAAHFELRYGRTELRSDQGIYAALSPVDAVLRYRWLTFALPEDLLLAAVPVVPPPDRVDPRHTLLERRVLDLGIAEIHQHRGAGWDFPLVWVGTMAALADPALGPDAMMSAGASFDEGRMFESWLLVAAIARVVLAEFLLHRRGSRSEPREPFGHYLRACVLPHHRHAWHTLRAALRALMQPDVLDPPDFYDLQDLYAYLHPLARHFVNDPPRSIDDVWRCDPVALTVGLSHVGLRGYGDAERWLVRHGLAYLENAGAYGRDPEFASVFWQTQRLRCLYYRYIVERPMTAGLQWFIRFYDRNDVPRRILDGLQPQASFRVSGRGERVMAALELRASSAYDSRDLARDMRRTLSSWEATLLGPSSTTHAGEDPEFGVLINFVKVRDPDRLWKEGRPRALGAGTHAQPRGGSRCECSTPSEISDRADEARFTRDAHYLKFGRIIRDQAFMARGLTELLCAVPLTLWLIRGIDVSADELAEPTWALVPIFEYVRQEAAFASILPGAEGAPPLRTTAHVGEDFRHLLEGMRRIYESIRYLLEPSGVRLGHAVALGVDPHLWAETTSVVLMPIEERLWDLVFEWQLYVGPDVPREFLADPPNGRAPRVENLIDDLARRIWPAGLGGDEPPTARELAALHQRLHRFMTDMTKRRPMRWTDLQRAMERGVHRLSTTDPTDVGLRRYLEDPASFHAGQQLVDVAVDESEVQGLGAIQLALRRGVAQRGIVIEVNPTSNLLIGDLLDPRHHPLLRLSPVVPEGDAPPVPIAIGSDDPVTFSTSLVGEYSMMYETARAAGYPAQAVDRWLEEIRRTALDARFTCAWRPDPIAMARRLGAKLDHYVHEPAHEPAFARHGGR